MLPVWQTALQYCQHLQRIHMLPVYYSNNSVLQMFTLHGKLPSVLPHMQEIKIL